mmetsp:Transcript_59250/g.139728  ORF Transcript_59250/g.139728 Transcript_59250/m.139728 type:complete len:204 (-) Transcript_59250:924-1535(-)
MQADQVIGQQVVERDLLAGAERMLDRHQRRQPAMRENPGLQPVVQQRRRENAYVGPPLGHRGLGLGAGQVFQADADLAVRLGKTHQVRRQRLGDRAAVGRDAQMPLDAARELHDLGFEGVERGMQRADMPHQRTAGLGRLDAPRPPLEQLHAEAAFEVGQALARRRQRQMLLGGAARDRAGLLDRQHEVEGGEVVAHRRLTPA